MNKRTGLTILTFAGVLTLAVACQKNNSQDAGAGVPAGYATTPQPCNISPYGQVGQPANCNQALGQYGFPGGPFMFPGTVNMSALNCGCPSPQVPFYNQFPTGATWGLGCGNFPGFTFPGATPWGMYGAAMNVPYANNGLVPYPGGTGAAMCGGSMVYKYCMLNMPGYASGCATGICQPLPGYGPATGVGYCQ